MAEQPTVVIVVDDHAGFLKGVARLLALNGIDTRTFASAEALIESGSAQTATCLLLDIHLGGISGIELQRRLAAAGSKCPVIFMTANDDEATRNEAVDAGCIAYLRKPFARQVCWMPSGKLWPNRSASGPRWVKNGSDPASLASPFCPQEQTSLDHPGMSEKCQ
jgi:CheY-like chemotaxis protein